MPKHRIFAIAFAKVYPLYVQKAERKSRTKEEVCRISAHRGRPFQAIVDGVSERSWTAFQTDRGRRFSADRGRSGRARVILTVGIG